MDEQWRWVIGLGVTLTFGWGTIFLAIGRRFLDALSKLETDIGNRNSELSREIREVRNDYVRRSDLDDHIQRLGHDVKSLRESVARNNELVNTRLDAVLAALITKNKAD